MRSIDQWLDAYAVSHQNPTNKKIHWICVPSIVFSLIGLLWSIPHGYFAGVLPGAMDPFLNWGSIFIVAASVYYLFLSRTIFVGMVIVASLSLFGNFWLSQQSLPLWQSSLGIFVVAWIGQFIGHKIEGAKPSFFEDIQFLLIGPAWCLSFLYKKLGVPV